MLVSEINILLVTDDPGTARRLADALSAVGGDTVFRLVRVASRREVEIGLDVETDIAVMEGDPAEDAFVTVIGTLHARQPDLPIVVITTAEDTYRDLALAAGAQQCLAAEDAFQPQIVRAMRESLAIRDASSDSEGSLSQESEFGTLHGICGPSPLPISEHSFGMHTLAEKMPDEFRRLTREYIKVIDQQLAYQTFKIAPSGEDEIDRLAERLGILNAGPRDVVEMHKVALASKLSGQSSLRTKAYLAESRLSLLKVMGYLVSFYRTRSWGRPVERRDRAVRMASVTTLPITPPDDRK